MILDVYVEDRKVGILEQHNPTAFSFSYIPGTTKGCAVSLLMPPREEPYTSSFLFPAFQVSLPEGYLRQKLERALAKEDKPFDDMGVLAAVGHNLIGRLKIMPHDVAPSKDNRLGYAPKLLTLDALLNDNLSNEDKPLDELRHQSGVSGGFSKFLARSSISGDGMKTLRTYTVDNWIVKLNDADHRNIVLLEHFGMMAAKKMGLTVPKTHLASDHSRILVKRFDIEESGNSLGFEDICALMGMPSREKFNGSVEKIIKIILHFCKDDDVQYNLEQFYAQYLLSAIIRNGDAHLKNFGLLYGNEKPPALAPVYDMLSMSVYAPANSWRDADDGMALTLGGTRRWPNAKALSYLGDLCRISEQHQQQWKDCLVNALLETSERVLNLQSEYRSDDVGISLSRMLELWSHGMRQINEKAADTLGERAMLLFPEHHSSNAHRPRHT